MSIDITDVRAVRKNALQNIRRAMYREGYSFTVNRDLFPTGAGMSQSQLSALYDFYENFYGGGVTIEDAFRGFQYEPDEEDIFDYNDYSYEDFDDYDYEPQISYVELCRDRIDALGYPVALNRFNSVIQYGLSLADMSVIENWFGNNMEIFDQCYADIEYYVKSAEIYGTKSTNYFVNDALDKLQFALGSHLEGRRYES